MALNIVDQIDDRVSVRTALISVSDKTGLDTLAPALLAAHPRMTLLSTGGTYQTLREILGREAEGRLTAVSDYTGQPEMQGGLVKTLDFKIYLGLLAETYNDAHRADLQRTGATPIDMVVANLYPFPQTLRRPDLTAELARTNIDIGGPCMVRAAAKNFLRVAVVTDPGDYATVTAELRSSHGTLGLETRLHLMRKAFAHTAAYDQAIARYFAEADPQAIRALYRTVG